MKIEEREPMLKRVEELLAKNTRPAGMTENKYMEWIYETALEQIRAEARGND